MPTKIIEGVNAPSRTEGDVPGNLTFHYGDHDFAMSLSRKTLLNHRN